MLKRVLVANRGEIAVRIIRACRELCIETVAVYSTADAAALHVELATKSICIGPPRASESYLNMQNILSAALLTDCDAIHPGYGFLSENSEFARLCTACGLKFIGPSPEVLDQMGNKSAARSLMRHAGIPIVPGSDGYVESVQQAHKVAKQLGYPVLLKAAAGGGGRGMRKAFSEKEIDEAFSTASAEAQACFGDGRMYLEKLIVNPKHVEIQILADKHGNVVHLGERDCSLQRRGQKLLEESPCFCLSAELRQAMGDAAIRAAKAANYENAGTVEFVLDKDSNFYFIEMNTRIQVEHPVTEMLTGVDLVREQLRIASGLPLNIVGMKPHGHVIECRINAEDPTANFIPSVGKVEFVHFAGGCGVRVDSALYNGYETSPFYDSMVAKIIVRGDTRLEAIRKMRRALEETVITGIKTTISLQHMLLHHHDILKGTYDTGFIEENLSQLLDAYHIPGGDI